MALKSNFAHKQLIVFNILKYKYGVNKSRDLARDHFAKIENYWPITGRFKKINRRALTFF